MLRLLIDGQNTDVDDFEYSAVDPGGFETLSVTLTQGPAPRPGAEVLVLDGLEVAWHGIVEEPGQHYQAAQATASVQAVGKGAELKRNPYSMVYIDRGLGGWKGVSRQRQINLGANIQPKNAPDVMPDVSSGTPALRLDVSGPIGGSSGGRCEAWYDAGDTNRIAALIFGTTATGLGAGWTSQGYASDDDFGGSSFTSDLTSTDVAVARYNLDVARRFVFFALTFGAAAAGDTERFRMLTQVAAIGDHGLPIITGPDGLDGVSPPDVAADAFRRSRAAFDLEVAPSFAYIAPHLVYPAPVTPEQIIDDMARLLGWHWGVWEPAGLGGQPRGIFAPPPAAATAVAGRGDFDELEVVEQLSRMHNQVLAAYQLPDGTTGHVSLARPHARLTRGETQTLELDVGLVGSAAAAGTIAAYTLALDQSQSRAAGQGVLPGNVQTAGGSRRPAHLLKPGRDRLRIRDLAGAWSVLDESPAVDTFRLRRITVTVTGGQPRTRVELDDGASLIETMQARLSMVAQRLGG